MVQAAWPRRWTSPQPGKAGSVMVYSTIRNRICSPRLRPVVRRVNVGQIRAIGQGAHVLGLDIGRQAPQSVAVAAEHRLEHVEIVEATFDLTSISGVSERSMRPATCSEVRQGQTRHRQWRGCGIRPNRPLESGQRRCRHARRAAGQRRSRSQRYPDVFHAAVKRHQAQSKEKGAGRFRCRHGLTHGWNRLTSGRGPT